MQIFKDFDLTKLNTLGVHARAREFVEINNEQDLKELFSIPKFKKSKKIFLGGGSNILFTKDFDGIVVLSKLQGIEIIEETSEYVIIKSMSGVAWDDFVCFTTECDYWGVENLSLIPGTVGGAPVQNIGAYGVELKEVLEKVETYNLFDGLKKVFTKDECEFGYRDSVFKNKMKGQYFITAVTFKLSKLPKPNLSYKILNDYLKEKGIKVFTSKIISDAVADIRRSKLPDPRVIGNAGSFFKNIFIDEEQLKKMLKSFPDIKYFKDVEGIKISSAWLIESCGWRGKKTGKVGVHEKHALVLVNHGGGTGLEIENLSKEIMESVYEKFGLSLVPEVNFI